MPTNAQIIQQVREQNTKYCNQKETFVSKITEIKSRSIKATGSKIYKQLTLNSPTFKQSADLLLKLRSG